MPINCQLYCEDTAMIKTHMEFAFERGEVNEQVNNQINRIPGPN